LNNKIAYNSSVAAAVLDQLNSGGASNFFKCNQASTGDCPSTAP
jgi:hypothetical protein